MTRAIALIAHDAKKPDMVAFAKFHRLWLADRTLVATESTGRLLERRVGLRIERMLSGVEGGDVQIAARVVQGEVEAVIFLVDPFDRHAHEPDIQSVQRVCQVHDIPLATNVATAHMILAALDYYGEEAAS
jgi:methylglyoxal synthase